MSEVLLPLVLLGCVLCVAFGIARLIAWFIVQGEAAMFRRLRETQIVAQARAEVRRG